MVAIAQRRLVRGGELADRTAIWRITGVFEVFGEYRSWLPDYLTNPGVSTFVCESIHGDPEGVVGFAMLSVYDPSPGGEARGELLAIGVDPRCQGRGVGTMLLERVLVESERLAKEEALTAVHLTVAHTNLGAIRLFERSGFRSLPGDHGLYDKGQRAVRMSRPSCRTADSEPPVERF